MVFLEIEKVKEIKGQRLCLINIKRAESLGQAR